MENRKKKNLVTNIGVITARKRDTQLIGAFGNLRTRAAAKANQKAKDLKAKLKARDLKANLKEKAEPTEIFQHLTTKRTHTT